MDKSIRKKKSFFYTESRDTRRRSRACSTQWFFFSLSTTLPVKCRAVVLHTRVECEKTINMRLRSLFFSSFLILFLPPHPHPSYRFQYEIHESQPLLCTHTHTQTISNRLESHEPFPNKGKMCNKTQHEQKEPFFSLSNETVFILYILLLWFFLRLRSLND